MKNVLGIICLTAFLVCGCSVNKVNMQVDKKHITNESTQQSSQSSGQVRIITFDDQKQVEELIKEYFSALEKKDYLAAWELTSSEQKKSYTKEEALKNHWGLETIKFVSMEGYLPSENNSFSIIQQNTPTIWFTVTLDIQPAPNSAWNKGLNERYVNVLMDSDGKWRIDGLATSP